MGYIYHIIFIINISETLSYLCVLNSGVPEGFALGPLLFIQECKLEMCTIYCNIAHKLKGREIKTKCIWECYVVRFMWTTFHRYSVRLPWVAWQIHLCPVSVHTLSSKSQEATDTASLIHRANSDKVKANGDTRTASLFYPQKQE
jgi:hypothetical protein